MKDAQDIQGTSTDPKSEADRQEDTMEKQEGREDKLRVSLMKKPSSVHFLPNVTSSDATTLPPSQSLSHEMTYGYYLSKAQISGVTVSTTGAIASKSTIGSNSQEDHRLGSNCSIVLKKQRPLSFDLESTVFGEGEDYFLSLFGDSKKLTSCSSHAEETYKHLSMILEEVGQSVSSSLGEIEIAEVNAKGLFVKLTNSSLDKELEIGQHILQQNVKGQAVSAYRFTPNVTVQAKSSVTAIAWYTPIHWKQAWEKLETDIEFDRCSAVTSTGKHMFQWTTSTTTITKEKQDLPKNEPSNCQVEQAEIFLKREKKIPPSLFPNHSPWCHSPGVPAHPYCPLIAPWETCTSGISSGGQSPSQSTRPDPGTKKKRKPKTKMQ